MDVKDVINKDVIHKDVINKDQKSQFQDHGLKAGVFKAQEGHLDSTVQPLTPCARRARSTSPGCRRHKLHLKAHFETAISLDRLKG
jgi:hypothetical protein